MTRSLLFSPHTIGRHEFKNRVVMAPIRLFKAGEDGVLTAEHLEHYVRRAAGGVGGIVTEAVAVSPTGRTTHKDLGLYNDAQEQALRPLVEGVHQHNCKIGIQLNHAGRVVHGTETVLSVSDKPFGDDYAPCRAATEEELNQVVEDFVQAAQRAARVGFDFVEISAAHGFLISSFLSTITNHRKDKYGGGVHNRYRLLGQILTRIRESVDIDVHVRISALEIEPQGNSYLNIMQYIAWATHDGAVFLSLTAGGVTSTVLPDEELFPGYVVPVCRKITKSGYKCGVAGMLGVPELAEFVLRQGSAQVIYVGRKLVAEPDWCNTAYQALEGVR